MKVSDLENEQLFQAITLLALQTADVIKKISQVITLFSYDFQRSQS